jgi:hypothetical protein
MSTPQSQDATTVRAPVVTIGPCGSGFLSVDPTIEQAIEHLRGHGVGGTTTAPYASAPPLDQLTLFDAGGRELRLDTATGPPELVISDPRDRSPEMRARIEETMAHVRERALRQPQVLAEFHITDADVLRPPDEHSADYLEVLTEHLAAERPLQDHVGGWWHNLLHRLG